ncbi:CoA transferase [Halostagnicola sp. A-GB9-2]|uniref:CoA transferase n=1 Tax=Halostagnicola sp. A-GB9-2 TaxID=3048066 RepID=UPI0024BFF83F|nr:CoA transferase [Halostagnicola sp. A-GB9-2]MDJ1433803.1 CoA transferase [Halostagnicola sp. A-GB9-2]
MTDYYLGTVAEAAHDEHLHERGMLQYVEDVDGSDVIATTCPARFSETPPEVEHGPHEVGADTRAVLSEYGYEDEKIDTLLETK